MILSRQIDRAVSTVLREFEEPEVTVAKWNKKGRGGGKRGSYLLKILGAGRYYEGEPKYDEGGHKFGWHSTG
jgi:hypothetical protein